MWSNKLKVENYCYRYFKRRKLLNLSVGLTLQGETYFFNYGFENSSPCRGETALYEIGSITKLFVAAVYAYLAEMEQISLRDNLQHLFKDYFSIAPQFRNISLSSLLDHSSGLPRLPEAFLSIIEDENDPYRDFDENIIKEYLILSTDQLSGKKYLYSNLGYGILGYLLTLKFGKPLLDIFREVILDPFGMTATSALPYARPEQLLKGHNISNRIIAHWQINCFQGAGLLLSNTSDLLKFLKAHVDQEPTYLALTTNFEYGKHVALAWHKYGFLSKILGFHQYLWHNGMTGGFSSYATINTRKKIAAVALTNKTDDLTECMIGLYGYLRT